MFGNILSFIQSSENLLVLYVVLYGLIILLPIALIYFAWNLWIIYVRGLFFSNQSYILLEVKLPRDIFKSPKAMEFFINGLWQPSGEGTFIEKFWKGQTRAWFSLEIVSLAGSIHFYIWSRKSFKPAIESNLYSQFPGIEIYEVPDYSVPFEYNPEVNEVWGTHFSLTKPDAYPIKTYLDYKLEENPEEEHKIDPLTPLIELLGSINKDHTICVQIVIRAHKAEDWDPVTKKMVDLKWSKSGQDEIVKILSKTKSKKDDTGKETPGDPLTKFQSETIEALERSITKNGFDANIRAIYIAPKDVFNKSYIGGIIGGITHFNSQNLNGFKPAHGLGINYAWIRDRKGRKAIIQKIDLIESYKKRMMFYHPHKIDHFVLNTEELATLFHFPGGVATTPTFTRVESKKAEAPSNLPI